MKIGLSDYVSRIPLSKRVELLLEGKSLITKRLLVMAAVSTGTAGIVLLIFFSDLSKMRYLGVFTASLASSATLFIPAFGTAVVVGSSVILEPWTVGLLAGTGAALGEMTGYWAGCSSRHLLKGRGTPSWLERPLRSHTGLVVVSVSVIPNPFVDLVGIIAGRMCYPIRRFLLFTAMGKIARSFVLAYLGAWGLPMLVKW